VKGRLTINQPAGASLLSGLSEDERRLPGVCLIQTERRDQRPLVSSLLSDLADHRNPYLGRRSNGTGHPGLGSVVSWRELRMCECGKWVVGVCKRGG
jgi:hypothetical protein